VSLKGQVDSNIVCYTTTPLPDFKDIPYESSEEYPTDSTIDRLEGACIAIGIVGIIVIIGKIIEEMKW